MYKKIIIDTLPSTNSYLKQNYGHYDDKTVIICNYQTDGHGRMGRSWESSTGNITLSILLKPKVAITSLAKLSLMTSASLYQVISKYVSNVKIKWPNDILVNNKKVCGILLESIISDKVEALIVGIGINTNSHGFSFEIKNKATSLYLETNHEYDNIKIIDEVIDAFNNLYQEYLDNNHNYLNICRLHSSIINRHIKINDENVYVLDIVDNGNLLVRNNNGMVFEVGYGEVTLTNEY